MTAADRQPYRQAGRQAEREKSSQSIRQIDIQTHTDRQADRKNSLVNPTDRQRAKQEGDERSGVSGS